MTDNNFPTDLQWSPKDIAREFGVSQATVFRRLKDTGLSNKGGVYSTSEVAQAMLSGYTAERTRLVVSQREEQELRVAQMRGELIHRDDLLRALTTIFIAVRQTILASDLSKADKEDILREISSFDVQVTTAEKRSKERLGVYRHEKQEGNPDALE